MKMNFLPKKKFQEELSIWKNKLYFLLCKGGSDPLNVPVREWISNYIQGVLLEKSILQEKKYTHILSPYYKEIVLDQ